MLYFTFNSLKWKHLSAIKRELKDVYYWIMAKKTELDVL